MASTLSGDSPARLILDELVARTEAPAQLASRAGLDLTQVVSALDGTAVPSDVAAAIEAAFDWPPGILSPAPTTRGLAV